MLSTLPARKFYDVLTGTIFVNITITLYRYFNDISKYKIQNTFPHLKLWFMNFQEIGVVQWLYRN